MATKGSYGFTVGCTRRLLVWASILLLFAGHPSHAGNQDVLSPDLPLPIRLDIWVDYGGQVAFLDHLYQFDTMLETGRSPFRSSGHDGPRYVGRILVESNFVATLEFNSDDSWQAGRYWLQKIFDTFFAERESWTRLYLDCESGGPRVNPDDSGTMLRALLLHLNEFGFHSFRVFLYGRSLDEFFDSALRPRPDCPLQIVIE